MIAQHLDAPICPECGQPATAMNTSYGIRHACCGLHSWGGKPLADQQTHNARKAAHEAFDALWKGPTAVVKRSHAYQLLAQKLSISRSECHMAQMPRELAERVPLAVKAIRQEHRDSHQGA
jgi:hypothetical protein